LPDSSRRERLPLGAAVVTGACGFIGQALMARLSAGGVRTIGFDIVEGSPVPFSVRLVDLASCDGTTQAIADAARELNDELVVFHLAGLANESQCRANPAHAVDANVVTTANVLEACRSFQLTRLVFPSTALVYGPLAPAPIREDAPLNPRSIYAASKIAAEAVLAGYASAYGFSIDIARLGNVYGPGGPEASVIGTMVRSAREHGRLHLKTLAPVRDFVHCDDVADGLVRLAEAGREPGLRVFNLSSGLPTSIADLARTVSDVSGIGLSPVETEPGSRLDDRVVLDVQRLRDRTGWVPSVPLREGLRRMLAIQKEQA
jgi:UDP-glucose 4-epimerase